MTSSPPSPSPSDASLSRPGGPPVGHAHDTAPMWLGPVVLAIALLVAVALGWLAQRRNELGRARRRSSRVRGPGLRRR